MILSFMFTRMNSCFPVAAPSLNGEQVIRSRMMRPPIGITEEVRQL
jgi:hypothetical protein